MAFDDCLLGGGDGINGSAAGEVNPRQGRVLSMLPAMLLYLIFFLLQSTLRNSAEKGDVDPKYAMWAVNLGYLALAIILNVWNTVPMRRLRVKFNRGAA